MNTVRSATAGMVFALACTTLGGVLVGLGLGYWLGGIPGSLGGAGVFLMVLGCSVSKTAQEQERDENEAGL